MKALLVVRVPLVLPMLHLAMRLLVPTIGALRASSPRRAVSIVTHSILGIAAHRSIVVGPKTIPAPVFVSREPMLGSPMKSRNVFDLPRRSALTIRR